MKVQILTHNNASTLERCLTSFAGLDVQFLVGDYGSTDSTLDICRQHRVDVYQIRGQSRSTARNFLAEKMGGGMWIEPWEALLQGKPDQPGYVRILQGKTATFDVRLWKGRGHFVNPIFEHLEETEAPLTNVCLASWGRPATDYEVLAAWQAAEPLSPTPHYYRAYALLADGKHADFLAAAEHYLFMDRSDSKPATMLRYYYAMVQLLHRREYKPCLQNLNLCLCVKPLMAEFWCLTGDVYYHLLKRFDQAKEFYENAMILGAKRLRTDLWPMDVSKYREYPKKMIESCDAIVGKQSFYGKLA
jgi:tetratricopeptide (TPR) repeat protein